VSHLPLADPITRCDEILSGQRVDADRINNLDRADAYTPALFSTGTVPVLGDTGTREGSWHRQGNLVSGWARFHFLGAGIVAGTATYLITPPWPIDPSLVEPSGTGAQGHSVGSGWIRDASTPATNRYVNVMVVEWQTGIYFWMQPEDSNTGVGGISPFTWASDDRITISFTYPTTT
jgi:hypothetical protein